MGLQAMVALAHGRTTSSASGDLSACKLVSCTTRCSSEWLVFAASDLHDCPLHPLATAERSQPCWQVCALSYPGRIRRHYYGLVSVHLDAAYVCGADTSMRMANLNLRFQARLRGVSMAFFMLSFILFIFVGWGTCVSYLQVFAGANRLRFH